VPDAETGDRVSSGAAALLFAASAALTIRGCASMAAMGEMPMPGGWTMSMTWMRMPGQTWPGAAASFVAMWTVMTAAMMTPSLVPMLARYRRAVACGARPGARPHARPHGLTALVAAGYFCVWTAVGAIAFAFGVPLATAAMQHAALARAAPLAAGVAVLVAGAAQLSRWKMRQLACCRAAPPRDGVAPPRDGALLGNAGAAWRHGLRLGLRCNYCCAALTAALLAIGVMNLAAMTAVGAAISGERLARNGKRMARLAGVLMVAAGLLMTGHALGVV
jgi:predicted metal-binding membrane protein